MATQNLSVYNKENIPNAKTFRFGIVISEWNKTITDGLLKGAKETLYDLGVHEDSIIIHFVPGSYELIFATNKMCRNNTFDAVISIGSIIRGETEHFNFVSQAVSQGIKDANVLTNTPAIFCVLTDDTLQQAIDRSGGKLGNKGVEAAVAAVKMAALNKELGQ